jgi:hypothetical protein
MYPLQAHAADAALSSSSKPMLPDIPLTFEQRCADPNVVLCDPLDGGRASGAAISNRTKNATLPEALAGKYRDWRWCQSVSSGTPTMDRDTKASGSGALRFALPGNSKGGVAGNCQFNFTPDNSVQFGEGDTFFVQFRVRFSCEVLYVDCDPRSPTYKQSRRQYKARNGSTALKVSIVNAGDHSELKSPMDSCTFQELVVHVTREGTVEGYHSCGWYDGHSYSMGLHKKSGSGLYDKQPIRKSRSDNVRGCYTINPVSGAKLTSAWHECIMWEADEWLTLTQQITIDRWSDKVSQERPTNNVRIWLARQGEQPKLVIDYDRTLRRPEKPFMRYGKVWLVPFLTDKDPEEYHPMGYIWFDELIVSRGPIAPAR